MKIVVYDEVGAISTFDVKTGKVYAHIAPYLGETYTGLAIAEDVEQMFVTAKDGILKEIFERKVSVRSYLYCAHPVTYFPRSVCMYGGRGDLGVLPLPRIKKLHVTIYGLVRYFYILFFLN